MKIFTNRCIVCEKLFDTTDKNKNKCSKECLRKYLSQKKKENWQDPEYRKNQSEKIKIGQNNPISKEKMAEKKRGKSPWNKGIPCSEEQKEKQSKVMIGHIPWNKNEVNIYSEETKKKISENTKIQMQKLADEDPEYWTKVITKRHNTIDKLLEQDPNYWDKINAKRSKVMQEYIQQDPEYLNKLNERRYKTKKLNNSFNTSKPEEEIYKLLIQKFNNVERQYKSDLYPFACDFYIPSLDLYIEYQVLWTHGKEPYDENNEEHIKLVESWKSKNSKFYNIAIKVWTIRDPKKRKIAKENNLNWIEFFSLKDFYKWYNN